MAVPETLSGEQLIVELFKAPPTATGKCSPGPKRSR